MSITSWLIIAVLVSLSPFLIAVFRRFILVPIRIHGQQRLAATRKLEQTRAEQLTPEMQEYLGQTVRQLRREGFEVVANVCDAKTLAGFSSWQTLLVNRDNHMVAVIVMVLSSATRRMNCIIGSRFVDGFRMNTSGNQELGHMPRNPSSDLARFAWASDPRLLVEAHRRRLARAGRAPEAALIPEPGHEVEFMDEPRRRELEWFERSGYFYLNPQLDAYCYTWKGAFLTIWKSVGWIKSIRTAASDKRMRRLWHDLGMAEFKPAAPDPLDEPAVLPAIGLPAAVRTAAPAPPPLPAADPSPMTPNLGIHYPSSFTNVEFQHDLETGSFTVHLAAPSFAQILASRTPSFLVIAVALPSMLTIAFLSWLFWFQGQYLPFAEPLAMLAYLALGGVFLVLEVRRVLRSFMRARGVMTATASRQGLRFVNRLSKRREGEIPREQLDQFLIVTESRMFLKMYRLDARRLDSVPRQPLFLSTNRPLLLQIARSLLQAMGRTRTEETLTVTADSLA
ncbi:MAG TPA: hypothetical protein VK797_00765 [Tepidisphaeraceae bacterium]|nr:hypothetical protein [Tepidisphaeraceae bacterium]